MSHIDKQSGKITWYGLKVVNEISDDVTCSVQDMVKYLRVYYGSYLWALWSFQMFTGPLFKIKIHLLSIVLLSFTPHELWNPLIKAVPGKFHGSGGHSKCNSLPVSIEVCFQFDTGIHFQGRILYVSYWQIIVNKFQRRILCEILVDHRKQISKKNLMWATDGS